MKYYTLEAVVGGKDIKFAKTFKTRNSAIKYMFKYFDKKGLFNYEVKDEYSLKDKHDIEYVIDYYNRFRIDRNFSMM